MSRARELLRKQFEDGGLPPDEDRELQAILREDESARAEYARWVELERAVEGCDVPQAQIERLLARGAPGPAAADPGSIDGDVHAAGSSASKPARWAAGVAALAVAAAILLVVTRPVDEGPRARSGGASGRIAWITVYQPKSSSTPRELARVDETARFDQPFAFAYANLRGSPYGFLAVAGRDAEGRVHWFHPAYTDPNQSPRSITIDRGVADRELGELVSVDAASGSMELCGLFTERPLDVKAVDADLESGADWPDAGLADCRTLELRGPP